jgi:ribosome-binding protein aMBF1 (putative translation factor)
MKSVCQVCGASFRGIPLSTVKGGKQVEVCPTCYKTLDDEYRKNSCLACVFFNVGSCELFGTELEEPYVQSAKCVHLTTSTDPTSVAMARIKKFEMTSRYEDAAKEYEKLGMQEKAQEARRKAKENPLRPLSVDELVEQLAQRGQTLTYFCCHCGAPLRVGANHEVLKSCPKCKYDLTVIDLAGLINQHL